jgi:hypothetical protein
MSKINYCLGTWSGERGGVPFDDSYLRRHIQHLNNLQHDLSQISIGHPKNPHESPEYTKYLRSLTALDDGTPIVVHDTPNRNMSYGQWLHMFQCYGNQFSHYILMEDDYVPAKDNFDSILHDMYEEKHKSCNCGYLCGLIYDRSGRYGQVLKRHAGVSNGITSTPVLQAVVKECVIPMPTAGHDQIRFSQQFIKSGFTIDDYLDQYRTAYYRIGKLVCIFEPSKKDLIIPIQCLDSSVVFDIEEWFENENKRSYPSRFIIT